MRLEDLLALKKRYRRVDKILYKKGFETGLENLRKDHKNNTIDRLKKILKEISTFDVYRQYSNHPLHKNKKDKKQVMELHVTDEDLLTWYYEEQNNKVCVYLVLIDLQDHKNLSNKIGGNVSGELSTDDITDLGESMKLDESLFEDYLVEEGEDFDSYFDQTDTEEYSDSEEAEEQGAILSDLENKIATLEVGDKELQLSFNTPIDGLTDVGYTTLHIARRTPDWYRVWLTNDEGQIANDNQFSSFDNTLYWAQMASQGQESGEEVTQDTEVEVVEESIDNKPQINRDDLTYRFNNLGYMIYYKGTPICGAGVNTKSNKRYNAKDAKLHRDSAEYEIRQILSGNAPQYYLDKIREIDSKNKNASFEESLKEDVFEDYRDYKVLVQDSNGNTQWVGVLAKNEDEAKKFAEHALFNHEYPNVIEIRDVTGIEVDESIKEAKENEEIIFDKNGVKLKREKTDRHPTYYNYYIGDKGFVGSVTATSLAYPDAQITDVAEMDKRAIDSIKDYAKRYYGIDVDESIKEDLELTATGEEISEPEEKQINNDYRNQLIEMINGEWETIQDYNDLVNMLANIEEYKEYIPVIEGIIEDEHHHIGNLQNVLDKLNPDSNKDIEHGDKEAQEILDEEGE